MGVWDWINLKFSKRTTSLQQYKNLLLKEGKEIPQNMEQEICQHLVYLEKNKPKKMFNPLLELKGFFYFFDNSLLLENDFVNSSLA